MMKSDAEIRAENLTFGLLVVAAGIFAFTGRIFDPFALLIIGLILLGSAVYQTRQGWHVSLTTWGLAILLTLGGLGLKVFLVAVLRVNWLAIGLVLIGGWWLYQNVFKQR